MTFLNGATAREFQAGRAYVMFLKLDCWCWGNARNIIRFGWEAK